MSTKQIFEIRDIIAAKVSLAGALVQNPIDELNWTEVEEYRKSLEGIRNEVTEYFNAIDNALTEAPTWTSQWELAEELYKPFQEDYDPTELDHEALAAEFIEKGLEKSFAEQLALSIAEPKMVNRYDD